MSVLDHGLTIAVLSKSDTFVTHTAHFCGAEINLYKNRKIKPQILL